MNRVDDQDKNIPSKNEMLYVSTFTPGFIAMIDDINKTLDDKKHLAGILHCLYKALEDYGDKCENKKIRSGEVLVAISIFLIEFRKSSSIFFRFKNEEK